MTKLGRQAATIAPEQVDRPRTERRNRESEVIEAAIQIFYAKGYSAASIQDVAHRVGVLKVFPTITSHLKKICSSKLYRHGTTKARPS